MNYMRKIIDIQDIENDIVVLYFKSDYCPDCVKMKKSLNEIESNFKNIKFYSADKKVNIDLFKHYDIYGVPSFIMLKDGVQIKRLVSKKTKTRNEVINWIKEGV